MLGLPFRVVASSTFLFALSLCAAVPRPPGGSKKQIHLFGTLAASGYFMGTPLRDLLFGSSLKGSGSRFLSSPFIIRVPFFLIVSFNKGTLNQKGQKGTTPLNPKP